MAAIAQRTVLHKYFVDDDRLAAVAHHIVKAILFKELPCLVVRPSGVDRDEMAGIPESFKSQRCRRNDLSRTPVSQRPVYIKEEILFIHVLQLSLSVPCTAPEGCRKTRCR